MWSWIVVIQDRTLTFCKYLLLVQKKLTSRVSLLWQWFGLVGLPCLVALHSGTCFGWLGQRVLCPSMVTKCLQKQHQCLNDWNIACYNGMLAPHTGGVTFILGRHTINWAALHRCHSTFSWSSGCKVELSLAWLTGINVRALLFPRFSPRNLCSLFTLAVFSFVYAATDTAYS